LMRAEVAKALNDAVALGQPSPNRTQPGALRPLHPDVSARRLWREARWSAV